MTEGAVALAPLPQADGRTKPRPVVLLRAMPPFGDWLVCGISTQLQQEVAGTSRLQGQWTQGPIAQPSWIPDRAPGKPSARNDGVDLFRSSPATASAARRVSPGEPQRLNQAIGSPRSGLCAWRIWPSVCARPLQIQPLSCSLRVLECAWLATAFARRTRS